MPSPVDNPPLAVMGLNTAQEISVHLSSAVDGLLPILVQQPRDIESAVSFPVSDLDEIVEQAVRIIQGLAGNSKKPQEAQKCAKTWAMVTCVVIVLVVVIVAVISGAVSVLTLGTVALMGTTIGSVVLPLNAVVCVLVHFLTVSARCGHPLAQEGVAIISQVRTALRSFVNANLMEIITARDKAMKEIGQALGRVEDLVPAVQRIEGAFEGDPEILFKSFQALSAILTRLIESLLFANSIPPAEVQSLVRALEKLRRAIVEVQPNSLLV